MTLRRKILAMFAVSLAVTLGAGFYFMSGALRADLLRESLDDMFRYNGMLAFIFREKGVDGLRGALGTLDGRSRRVTCVAADGTVLYDSEATDTDNHLDRPEIRQAIRDGEGSSLRYSYTLHAWMLYGATRVAAEGGNVYIRTAWPITLFSRIMRALLGRAFLYALPVVLLVALFGVWLTRRIFAPLERIVSRAGKIGSGEERFPLFQDPELRKLSIALNDMSDRLRDAHGDIRAGREELERIIEGLPVGIVLVGPDRNLRSVNDVARVLLGRTRTGTAESFVSVQAPCVCPDSHSVRYRGFQGGQRSPGLSGLCPPEPERVQNFVGIPAERFILHRGICEMLDAPDSEGTFLLPLGDLRVSVRTLTIGTGRLLVLRDVTEERRMEETRRNFVIEAGHDLQTPLTSIRAAAELLLENIDDGTQQDEIQKEDARLLKTILRQQERMTSLIDNMLLLVKLEGEDTKEERRPEDLAEILRTLTDELREAPAARYLSVETSLPPGAPVRVARAEVMRALSNVLDNALRKCGERWQGPGGKIFVTLEAEQDAWVVTITDNGGGVSPEVEDRIFESFHGRRVGRSGKWGSDGHGLGLSITARILKMHG
ncbi:MAG: HAMP domain-containing protein, partial [Synergistaceae bacterium]|nr:HAMP domain-containing protein [Synergistaceae bacterium]